MGLFEAGADLQCDVHRFGPGQRPTGCAECSKVIAVAQLGDQVGGVVLGEAGVVDGHNIRMGRKSAE